MTKYVQIEGFSKYYVNAQGHILSKKCSKEKKIVGYTKKKEKQALCRDVDGVYVNLQIARLVLTAFVGKPTKEKPRAIHINGNKTDNRLRNLKWGTLSDVVTNPSFKRNYKSKSVTLIDFNPYFSKPKVRIFKSLSDASRRLNMGITTVRKYCTTNHISNNIRYYFTDLLPNVNK